MSIIESYLMSKKGEMWGGEDRLVIGPYYYGVIDGVTDKSGNNWSNSTEHITGGSVLANLLKNEFEYNEYRDIESIIKICNEKIHEIANNARVDMNSIYNRPVAVFTVYSPRDNKIHYVGNCPYIFVYDDRYDVFYNEHPLSKITSKMRADILIPAIEHGYDMSEDVGRKVIMPILKRQSELINSGFDDETIWFPEMLPKIRKKDIAMKGINGTKVDIDYTDIPDNVVEIIITSDGFVDIFPDLEDTLLRLKEQLVEDPHCIGTLCSTKGLRPGNISFDDMAYLKIRLK